MTFETNGENKSHVSGEIGIRDWFRCVIDLFDKLRSLKMDCNFWERFSIDFQWKEENLVKAPSSFLDVTFGDIKSEEHDSPSIYGQADSFLPFGKSKLFQVPIKDARILIDADNEDEKKIVEITLDIKDIPLEFFPGDTIGILPQNSENDVNTILKLLEFEQVADKLCNISIKPDMINKKVKIPSHIPQSSTVQTLFRDCIAFNFPPKKQFFRLLYDYSENECDKKILASLCAKDSKVYNTVLKNKFNLLKTLKYFTSCRPPLNVLIEQLPRLLPRPYSIANSPLLQKDELKILFSVLNTDAGLTTKMMEQLANEFINNPRRQDFLNCYLRQHNHFRYTEEEFTKNIIMISVGCAIVPFIGFMQHKSEIKKNGNCKSSGKAWLFTGFRHPDVALYREEIEEFHKIGVIDRIFESFSRDSSCKFKYVQDSITENAEEFVNFLLDTDTILYICADGAEISKSIQQCIEDAIATVINCDKDETKRMIAVFKKELKYREDIWV